MKIYRISMNKAARIVHELGFSPIIGAGRSLTVLYDREDGVPRHMACAHEYAECIEAILRAHPEAGIETAVTFYRGLDDFLARKRRSLDEALSLYPCDIDHSLDTYPQ